MFIVVSLRSTILTCCNESLKLVFVHVAVPCVVYIIALWIWILVYTSSLDLRIVFVVILLLWITHCGLTTRVEMAKKCSAFGCRKGYESCADLDKRITFHTFPRPRDTQVREKWIKARKGLCAVEKLALYFRDDDCRTALRHQFNPP